MDNKKKGSRNEGPFLLQEFVGYGAHFFLIPFIDPFAIII